MTDMSVLETLVKARALIEREENWWPGPPHMANGKNCAVTAITAITTVLRFRIPLPDFDEGAVLGALSYSLPDEWRHRPLPEFNDAHTHKQVLDLFSRAIATEKRKLNIIERKTDISVFYSIADTEGQGVGMRPRNFDLSGTTDPQKLAQILEQMVFTAAKDYRRYLYIDPPVRDMIVKALRAAPSGKAAA